MLSIGDSIFDLDNTIPQLFPFQWIRPCITLDTPTGQIQVVVNGHVLENSVYQLLKDLATVRPTNINGIYFGQFYSKNSMAKFTNLQIFSSVLSIQRMVAITSAGSEECGATGDLMAWQDMQWTLSGTAQMETVFMDDPCTIVSDVHVFTGVAEFLSEAVNHCRKIRNGQLVSVTTLDNYITFEYLVDIITFNRITQDFFSEYIDHGLYVPITYEETEGLWTDAYTGNNVIQKSYCIAEHHKKIGFLLI